MFESGVHIRKCEGCKVSCLSWQSDLAVAYVCSTAELDALEDLHQFRMREIRPDLFEYEFLDKYLVSLPCRAFQPVNQGISITYLPGRPIVRDDFPKYTALVLQTAKRRIIEGPNRTIPKVH